MIPAIAGALFLWLLGGNVLTNGDPKVSQPPVQSGTINNQPAFQGWNVVSVHDTQWAAADDFVNSDLSQVSGIDWWGSYVSWSGNQAPAVTPSGFWFGIYDNAAGKPGNLLWSYSTTNFSQSFAGYDMLDSSVIDSMFSYSIDLPQASWFTPTGVGSTNWLSIQAIYPGSIPPVYTWGWKTRPEVTGEDAQWLVGNPPDWTPLVWDEHGWDTAFQLRDPPDTAAAVPESPAPALAALACGFISLVRLPFWKRKR